ncbi:FAD-dependent monooxygenase [Mycolicibacterium sp.]|uniref:FAD-dependent monooxygenase n=1 Tax=Mycolicibacterium sp. TaxID=2320850 RepID=UPI003D148C74
MKTRAVAVIGGGPAGLYAARLIKLADPAAEVVVHERIGIDTETFGFGVGLTESTMANLSAADPETADRIRAVSYAGHNLELRSPHTHTTALLHGARNLAIGRAELLSVLCEAAVAAGVDYRPGSKVDLADVDAEVVVAADGVRSAVRAKLSTELGVHESLGRGRYMWCGVDFAVDAAFFTARIHPGGGFFVAHAYPYRPDRSTFLIEADDTTWHDAGLHRHDTATEPGNSDTGSIALLQEAFAEDLRGRPLLTNRTRWARFTTLTLQRWSAGNVVLIGDAAHTAHYTLGSGTKLALEDAIALSQALTESPDTATAFARYEQRRRPAVERFKHLAGRSQRWWESYRVRVDAPTELLALSYMTRSGNLAIADYARDQPDVVAAALNPLGDAPPRDLDAIDDWVLTRPARVTTPAELDAAEVPPVRMVWSHPDVWDETADDAIASLRTGDAAVVHLTGEPDPVAIGARLDFAERIRIELRRTVIVTLPAEARPQAAAAIAAGRCDAVAFGT